MLGLLRTFVSPEPPSGTNNIPPGLIEPLPTTPRPEPQTHTSQIPPVLLEPLPPPQKPEPSCDVAPRTLFVVNAVALLIEVELSTVPVPSILATTRLIPAAVATFAVPTVEL